MENKHTDFMLGKDIVGIRDLAKQFADDVVVPTAICWWSVDPTS